MQGNVIWTINVHSKVKTAEHSMQMSIDLPIQSWELWQVKRKMYCLWDRSKTFSASERLLWALIRQNAIFLKSHLTMWPLSLGRDSQLDHCDTELILLDTSWHWVDTQLFCSCSQPVLGGGIGTERQFIIVIIIRGNYLTLSLQNIQLLAPLGPSELGADWPTHNAWTQQRIYTDCLWHHSTWPYNSFTKAEIPLKVGFELHSLVVG